MTLAVIAFLAIFVLAASGGLLLFYRDPLLNRLSLLVGGRSASARGMAWLLAARPAASVESIVMPFQKILPRSPEEVSVQQKRLIRAGFRDRAHVNVFYGAKVAVPLLLAVLATATGLYRQGAFFVYAVALGVGFLAPDFWLGRRIQRRQLQVRLGLPETLDLMVICSEAGMGLDQMISRVADEVRLSQPELSDELGLVSLEHRAGRPRDEALRNLADRVDIDTVRALVNTLVQADTFGTSIAKTLRVYSDTLRTQRRQQAEEQAAKTTVKLVFPLVFFIFPSLFVVALGPSLIVMFESLTQYLLN